MMKMTTIGRRWPIEDMETLVRQDTVKRTALVMQCSTIKSNGCNTIQIKLVVIQSSNQIGCNTIQIKSVVIQSWW
jgi:hypothetical protein